MVSKINSIAVNGLETSVIEAEIDINNGLPSFTIVGLPDQSVQESKERIRSSLRSSWTRLPANKIIVNLAPADIRKTGPSFDLPIAVGILLNEGTIVCDDLVKDSVFIWELALDWNLRKVSSVLPATIWAKERWFKRIFVPRDNAKEASIIPWIDVIAISSLLECVNILNYDKDYEAEPLANFEKSFSEFDEKYDFKYIQGQEHAKRALEISAAWGHNILMNGPPWSWKTMLSRAYSTILPDLTVYEAIEISKIYSIANLLNSDKPIISERPFRTVHHTASSASIIGWGRNAKPWEISLAHKWVLFLDELLEFKKNVLEILRQPLEDWNITVNRVNASFEYPAKFTLIWAMNPCPCWYLTDEEKECVCSAYQIQNYKSRLSWPLLDRVDIFIEVPKVDTEKLSQNAELWESSVSIRERVSNARNIQLERFKEGKITSNSEMSSKDILLYCALDTECEGIMKMAVSNMNLSARSYYRILKLSRTIADLWGFEHIWKEHILEALSYRKSED